MQIPQITLASGRTMPQVGFGTWRLWGGEGIAAIGAALGLGYRHLDTADYYENHAEVATAMADYRREEIFLTSKVWPDDLHHDDLIATCERNLLELRTEYLDLYLIHWPNPAIPMAESLGALAELVQRGLVRSIGVCNFVQGRLAEALEVSPVPISSHQFELHPLLYQRELVGFCQAQDVAVTAFCPIARGAVYENAVIAAIADETGRTCAQVSLRWLLQKGGTVIPRSKSTAHIAENLDILDWELSAEQMARIDAIAERRRLIRMEDYDEFDE